MAILILQGALLSLVAVAHALPLFHTTVPSNWADNDRPSEDHFVVRFPIGNPSKTYNLTLDLYDYRTFLLAPNGVKSKCGGEQRRKYFDTSRSTTFRQFDKGIFELHAYMVGEDCFPDGPYPLNADVIYGREDFKLDKVTAVTPLGVVTSFNGSWSPFWASDGVLGLSNPHSNFSFSAARRLAQVGADQKCPTHNGALCETVSFYLSRDARTAASGAIEFGPVSRACGKIEEAEHELEARLWSAVVVQASLGDASVGMLVGHTAVIRLYQSYLAYIPQPVMDQLMSAVPARFDGRGGERPNYYTKYSVKCSDVAKLPTLTIGLDGATLSFKPSDYVDQSQRGERCPLLIRGSASTWETEWSFGNHVARSHCIVLNYVTSKLGFGPIVNAAA